MEISAFFQMLMPKIYVLLAVVFFDVVLGVWRALIEKQFQWQRLGEFLSKYGMKAVGWVGLECLQLIPADIVSKLPGGEVLLTGLGLGAYIALVGSGIGSFLDNARWVGLLPVAFAERTGVSLPDENFEDDLPR